MQTHLGTNVAELTFPSQGSALRYQTDETELVRLQHELLGLARNYKRVPSAIG